MLFQTKDAPCTTDTYERAKTLVTALLHHECPAHSPRQHLLFTTNQKLEQYREARDYYRQQIHLETATGIFAREAYEVANQQFHQLYVLIRAYMHLADETKRSYFNHHLSLQADKVSQLYEQYTEHQHYTTLLHLEQAFWSALKEDVAPLFTQIE